MQYIIFADKRLMHIHDNSVVGSLDFGQERRWQFSNVLWRKTLSSAIAPSTALRAISRSPRRGSIPHRRSAMQAAPGKLALPHNVWVRGGRARRLGPAASRGARRRAVGTLCTGGVVLQGVCTLPERDAWDFVHWRGRSAGGLYTTTRPQCTKSPPNGVASVQSRQCREAQCTKPDRAHWGRQVARHVIMRPAPTSRPLVTLVGRYPAPRR